MSKRVLIVVALALVVAAAAFYLTRPETGVPEGAPTEAEMARDIGAPVMTNLYRGHVPGRSGELMLVPQPHNFLIGEWDLRTLAGTPTMSTSHPNPWNYLARVPIIAYGPPWVPSGVTDDTETDIAALAPAYADILGGVQGFDSDVEPLPGIERRRGRCLRQPGRVDPCADVPKAIVTVVLDGGGWNTLQQHPDSWPFMAALREQGMTYTNATIGSAPSITGALHATLGTGVYPIDHGIPGNQMRGEDGKNTDTWLQNADPRYLKVPTVSELWDEQNDNEAVVGTVSYEGWHLGMIGHGAQREGGDKDIAALWEAVSPEDEVKDEWFINTEYYTLPDYLPEPQRLFELIDQLDPRDGLVDGTWFGHSIDELKLTEGDEAEVKEAALARPGTPAFVQLTGDAVIDVMRRERIGRDDITDMFWVEMKMPDYTGHAWNMAGPEEEDVLRETDRQLARMKEELDRTVGRGNYVFTISADHGQQPLPELQGGWRINSRELHRDIEARFGDIVEKVTPVDVYFDLDAVEEEGIDLADVARYVGTYTLGENIPEGRPGEDLVPEGRRDELLFAGAFSTDYFRSLDPAEIESFGPGEYPEGDLFLPFEAEEAP